MIIDFKKLPYIDTFKGNTEIDINAITMDSRKCFGGSLFIALKGTAVDGHEYISSAIDKGATAIACETMPKDMIDNVTYIKVSDSHKFMGHIAKIFYGDPSSKLKLIGVTGTNGKTTTVTLLYDMFTALGYKVGLISTVIYKVGDKEYNSTHTTPDAIRLNELLTEMVGAGCDYCFMEVSSHSIVQNRIEGLTFAGGIFTNITHDHLDYHGTFAEYIKAKQAFFTSLSKGAFALYNADDKNGEIMVQNSRSICKGFALKSLAQYRCKVIESMFGGMLLEIDSVQLWVRFIGEFNAYNLLGVYAAAIELGVENNEVLRLLSSLHSVDGRFEYVVNDDGVTAIIDYAHTPDALDNVINTINKIRKPSQKLYTVVGCGGNRDKTKRPIMAKVAVDMSDFVILTSDNPRFEEPMDILEDMQKGVENIADKWVTIESREQAIKMAVRLAKGNVSNKLGDIILIAGKGHETYQEIKGVRHHFDDKECVKRLLNL